MTVVQMPGAEMERRGPSLELEQYVSPDGLDQIERALPEGVSLARFDQAFMTATLAMPDLAKVEKTSLFLALVKCAQRGLVPDSRQAVILPFNNRKKGIVEAQFIEMIGGVRDRMARHGWLLSASVVRASDRFEIDKAEAFVLHRPAVSGDRGDVIGAYALAKHRDGRQRMADYMTIEEINELRDQMGVDKNPAWTKWPDQMAEKTVAHRLAGDVGLNPEDQGPSPIILNATELPPQDPAEALYGPGAGTTFSELPSGVQPAEQPPVAGDVATQGIDPTPSVSRGDTPSGSSDEETPSGEPAAAAAPPELDDDAVMFAADAAEIVPPSGRYAEGGEEGPLNLAGILDLGEPGRKYLDTVLRKSPNEEYRLQVEAFARIHMPEEYAAMVAAREQKAA